MDEYLEQQYAELRRALSDKHEFDAGRTPQFAVEINEESEGAGPSQNRFEKLKQENLEKVEFLIQGIVDYSGDNRDVVIQKAKV